MVLQFLVLFWFSWGNSSGTKIISLFQFAVCIILRVLVRFVRTDLASFPTLRQTHFSGGVTRPSPCSELNSCSKLQAVAHCGCFVPAEALSTDVLSQNISINVFVLTVNAQFHLSSNFLHLARVKWTTRFSTGSFSSKGFCQGGGQWALLTFGTRPVSCMIKTWSFRMYTII